MVTSFDSTFYFFYPFSFSSSSFYPLIMKFFLENVPKFIFWHLKTSFLITVNSFQVWYPNVSSFSKIFSLTLFMFMNLFSSVRCLLSFLASIHLLIFDPFQVGYEFILHLVGCNLNGRDFQSSCLVISFVYLIRCTII